MRAGWVRGLVVVVGFLVVVGVGGFGSTLFWSVAFVAWACACLAVGVLGESFLRHRERSRGWDESDRPVLLRPVEWSIVLVVISAFVGSGNTTLMTMAGGVASFAITIPYARRERRKRKARGLSGDR